MEGRPPPNLKDPLELAAYRRELRGVASGVRWGLDAEHRAILTACRQGDPERAASAVRHHLRQTVEHVALRLEDDAR